jgi:hypothetical protein
MLIEDRRSYELRSGYAARSATASWKRALAVLAFIVVNLLPVHSIEPAGTRCGRLRRP